MTKEIIYRREDPLYNEFDVDIEGASKLALDYAIARYGREEVGENQEELEDILTSVSTEEDFFEEGKSKIDDLLLEEDD